MNDSQALDKLLKALEAKSARSVEKLPTTETSSAVDTSEVSVTDPEHYVPPGNYLPELYNVERDIGLRIETGSARLKKLKPKHKKIIALHLAGWPNNDIADHMEMSATYIAIVLRDPLCQEVIHTMDDLHEEEFMRLRAFANDALRNALQPTKPDKVRLQAASIFYKRESVKAEKSGETAEDVMLKVLAKIEAQNVQINLYPKAS